MMVAVSCDRLVVSLGTVSTVAARYKQPGPSRTHDMESCKTGTVLALNARATLSVTQIAAQTPPCFGNVAHAIDRLHKN
jgi:hypothetical protein